jgi:hypothetical protein
VNKLEDNVFNGLPLYSRCPGPRSSWELAGLRLTDWWPLENYRFGG